VSPTKTRIQYVTAVNPVQVDPSTLEDQQVIHYSIPVIQETGGPGIEIASDIASSKWLLQGGEVLVSKLNVHKNCVAIVGNHAGATILASTEFVAFTPISIEPRFLKYIFQSEETIQQLSSFSESATRSHARVNPSDIIKYKACQPPLDTQRLIADYLDRETARIDALVAEKEKMLALLDEKRAALISRAVTRGLDPNAPLKPSGQEWLGAIPAHWEVLPLRWFMRIGSGEFLSNESISKDETEELLIPVVGGNGVLGYTSHANTENALVIGRVGAQCGNVHFVDGSLWVTDNALLVKITSRFEPRYLREVLHLMELNTLANQSAQPLITGEMVKNQKVPAPPMSEQSEILQLLKEALGEYVNLLKEVERSLRLLKERHAALIAAAVTGQIPVEEMSA
jgi:type I restriction enzyme S subunit